MDYITDRAERQVNRLTAYVRENNDFANLVKALGGVKWQALEDVYNDMFTKRHLGDAGNAQLDVIGRHLITARQGLDDETYTALLDTRYEFFQRSGEPERLIELFQSLTGAYLVEYDDTYKLQCNVLIGYFNDLSEVDAVNTEKLIADMTVAKQAGQGLRLVLAVEPVFTLSDDPVVPELDSDNGLDSGFFPDVILEC